MTLLNFAVDQEKHVDKVCKKLVESNGMTEKNRKLLKPVCSKPGVMYSSCNANKASAENCLSFRPILSTLNTPNYNFAKFLVEILKPLTTNEFTVQDSFHFAEEMNGEQPDLLLI